STRMTPMRFSPFAPGRARPGCLRLPAALVHALAAARAWLRRACSGRTIVVPASASTPALRPDSPVIAADEPAKEEGPAFLPEPVSVEPAADEAAPAADPAAVPGCAPAIAALATLRNWLRATWATRLRRCRRQEARRVRRWLRHTWLGHLALPLDLAAAPGRVPPPRPAARRLGLESLEWRGAPGD